MWNKEIAANVSRETKTRGEIGKNMSKYLFHVKHSEKKRKIFGKPCENSCKKEKVVLYYG